MIETPSRPTLQSPAPHSAPYCPLYRAEYKGDLQKLTIKIHTLPPDLSYIEGHLMWQKQPILLKGRLSNRHGRLVLTAYLEGNILLNCRHTGKRFTWHLKETITEPLNMAEEPELFEHGLFNIAEWARQQVELAIPAYPQSPHTEGSIVSFALQQEEKEEQDNPDSPFSVLKCLMVA